MRRMRSKQSLYSLKTDLKKIDLFYLTFIHLSLFAGVALGAEQLEIYAGITPKLNQSTFLLDVSVNGFPEEEILSAIFHGFRSEITYGIKLYQVKEGFLSFFGDRLVTEEYPTIIAGWDQFERVFYLFDEYGERKVFFNEDDFFANLSGLTKYSLSVEEADRSNLYVLINIQIVPVRLIPPLSIINILPIKNEIKSPWVQFSIPPKESM